MSNSRSFLSLTNERKSLFSRTLSWEDTHSSAPGIWTYGFRIFIFILLEASILTVAGLALRDPLLLPPSSLGLRTLKGGFTVVSIIWHTLAIFPVQSIVTEVISGEWYFVGKRSGTLRAGRDDTVSTLTADLMDHSLHALTSRASKTYRGAVVLSALLVALGGVGPGTIGVSQLLVNATTSIDIADLSHLKDMASPLDTGSNTKFWIDRAELIIRTEIIDGTTFGYATQPNYVIPTPGQSFELGQVSQENLTYHTDIIQFNYDCRWHKPQGDMDTNQVYTTNYNFQQISSQPPAMFDESGMRWTLYPGNNWFNNVLIIKSEAINGTAGGVYQLYNTSTSRAAFLFISGTNKTSNPNSAPLIDLTDLPTVPTETILPNGPVMVVAQSFPLSAMLVCDPGPSLMGRIAVVGQDGSLTIANSASDTIGNIPQSGLDMMFSTALTTATTSIEAGTNSMSINAVISSLFFTDKNFYSLFDITSNRSAEILPLAMINQNMNTFMLSASKAYTDGYMPIGESTPYGTFPTIVSKATVKRQRMGLVTTRILFYITVVLGSLVLVLSPFLFAGWKIGRNYPFNLVSLTSVKYVKLG